jgi:O-antigen/teichoic acid export membrane protein
MSVRRNVVASALGDGWAALIQLVLVPVYIALLGVEAYGLIGAVAILSALFAVLDAALAPAITRSVAQAFSGERSVGDSRTLLRSVEVLLLGVGLATTACGFVTAEWLAERWFKAESLEAASAAAALRLLAFQIAARLFVGIYRAVVVGAQELVWLSGYAAGFATLRGVGMVPVLWAWPGVEAYFAFQGLVTVFEAGFLGGKAWRLLSDSRPASFSSAALAEIRRFSTGTALMSAFWQALHQADKAVLSTVLPLSEVGRYALATSAAGGLAFLAGPFFGVALPRFTELASRRGDPALAQAFHGLARMVALLMAPAAWVMALYAEPLLFTWTRDRELSAGASPILAVLAAAGLLKGFMTIPGLLQLAIGRSHALATVYGAMLVVLVPSTYFGATSNGAMAGAYAWVLVTALALALLWPLVSAALSAREARLWLARDVVLPVAAAGLGAWLVRSMVDPGTSGWAMGASAAAAYLSSLAFTVMVTRRLRAWRT